MTVRGGRCHHLGSRQERNKVYAMQIFYLNTYPILKAIPSLPVNCFTKYTAETYLHTLPCSRGAGMWPYPQQVLRESRLWSCLGALPLPASCPPCCLVPLENPWSSQYPPTCPLLLYQPEWWSTFRSADLTGTNQKLSASMDASSQEEDHKSKITQS